MFQKKLPPLCLFGNKLNAQFWFVNRKFVFCNMFFHSYFWLHLYDLAYENRKLLIMQSVKQKITDSLLKTGAFWSYDKTTLKAENISDNLLIENTLIYGDTAEIRLLFQVYSKSELLAVWTQRLLPDDRLKKLNYWLAVCVFDIADTKKFIEKNKHKYSRYEKLKQLADGNTSGISEII